MPRDDNSDQPLMLEGSVVKKRLKRPRKQQAPQVGPAAQLLLNRELGQLEFNRRVLAQAADAEVPLLERVRFLCIVSSNLDEFFEIRVAGLKAQMDDGADVPGPDGALPSQVFREVSRQAHELVARQY